MNAQTEKITKNHLVKAYYSIEWNGKPMTTTVEYDAVTVKKENEYGFPEVYCGAKSRDFFFLNTSLERLHVEINDFMSQKYNQQVQFERDEVLMRY